ncbi:MAG: Bax inhibitor-1/YccA family protein [Desulfatitalea sp.]|nr:Bax inhibitor-1/YccA family protein [Desulfatitalea sp.]NNJ99302.1 Bax inhibitor-1/YccA family protein [Desulfatitalea sp.]
METRPSYSMDQTQVQTRVSAFVRGVYNWMALGLALTGFVAYFVATNAAMFQFVQKTSFLFFIAELALVFSLAARINKIKASTATALFMTYAALNGATFSYIFYAYAQATIASTFFICAASFLGLSIIGWTTKKDLSGLGRFMMMGLIGIIIASLVNIFLGSYGMQMIISYIGVIIFAGLTAYDTQKIKMMAMTQPANVSASAVRKGSIIGALQLYLDFILMFQYLLFIFGGSRD